GQPGAVYTAVPRARQERALAFLAANAVRTPEWLAPAGITSRTGSTPVANAQAAVLATLLEVRRLDRLAMGERMSPDAYPLPQYLVDLRRAVWSGRAPDANLRALQRVYLDRLEALVSPPAPPAGGPGAGGGGGGEPPPSPLLAQLNVERSDLPALARSELRAIRADALASAAATSGVQRAHWADVAARVDAILDPAARGRTAAR
ncbi:MAG: zinc-dependent metalloprotease, partial [Longimicrobiaceae bacterium]